MAFGRYVFGTLGNEANIIIQYYLVPCRLSSEPQNIWPWMTLTGYLALNSVFAPVWLAEMARLRKIIAWKLIEIDTYFQQWKSSAGTLVSGDIRFMRIFAEVPWEGPSNDSGVIENVDFLGFWTLRHRHLRKWRHHYYIVLFSPLLPFQWPQNLWPWMTMTGYFPLNFVFAPVWLADIVRLWK